MIFSRITSTLRAELFRVSLGASIVGALFVSLAATGASARANPQPKIAVLVPLASDPFWQSCVRGADQAAHKLGIGTLKSYNANDSTPTQAAQIEDAITAGDQAIVISANDSKALDPQLRAAMAHGVRVYEDNTAVPGVKVAGTVQMNEVKTSDLLGTRMLQLAKKRGIRNFTALELVGVLGTDVVSQRTDGFAKAMARPPAGMHVRLIKKLTNWVTTTAVSETSDVLSTTKINGIFTQSDLFSPSIVPTLKSHGYGPVTSRSHVILAGLGGLPGGVVAVRDGFEDFTMNYPIDGQCDMMVRAAYQQIVHHIPFTKSWRSDASAAHLKAYAPQLTNGTASGPNVYLSAKAVTKANVNSSSLWANHFASSAG